MKEIKFRAWNTEKQVMCDVIAIDFENKKVTIDIETNKDEFYWPETEWKFADVELLQYTGLKDLNDCEIYEGDIVKTKIITLNLRRITTLERNGVVKFGDCNFYILESNNTINPLENYSVGLVDTLSEIEVIGNIYETPEFLEDYKCGY